jgi:hypothetical protein
MEQKTPKQRVEDVFDEATGADLSSWEKFEFLPSVKAKSTLSDKEEALLRGIEKRLFGEGENDEC